MTQFRWVIPQSRTKQLTATDVAVIRTLANDARMPLSHVAGKVGVSTRTVRNRLEKLRGENTIHLIPTLDMGGVPGLIPVHLSYTYSRPESKGMVDGAMVSRFEANYLSFMFSDPDRAYAWLVASTMNDVRDYLEWAKSQPGVASARADILVKWLTFPDKLVELLSLRNVAGALRENASQEPCLGAPFSEPKGNKR